METCELKELQHAHIHIPQDPSVGIPDISVDVNFYGRDVEPEEAQYIQESLKVWAADVFEEYGKPPRVVLIYKDGSQ